MARVLIAGAGYVGTALALRLAEQGHQVHGLRRDPTHLPPSVLPLRADLSDPCTLEQLPDDVDHVVFAAAADSSEPEAYRATYVRGLRHLIEALQRRRAPVRRLVFTSSTAVYAQSDGDWVDESSPTQPRHFTGELMLEAERAAAQSGWPTVILRLGGIYGPGRARMIEQVRAGHVTTAAGGSFVNRIHRDDCAGAAAHLLFLPEPAPVYLGVDDEPASSRVLLEFVAERLGRPLAALDLAQGGTRTRGSNKRCRNARLRASGYVFRYPTYREGYGALIDAERSALT